MWTKMFSIFTIGTNVSIHVKKCKMDGGGLLKIQPVLSSRGYNSLIEL